MVFAPTSSPARSAWVGEAVGKIYNYRLGPPPPPNLQHVLFPLPGGAGSDQDCTTTTPAWRMDDRADAVNNGPRPRLRLGGMASIPFGDWKREKSGSADWGAGMNKLWEDCPASYGLAACPDWRLSFSVYQSARQILHTYRPSHSTPNAGKISTYIRIPWVSRVCLRSSCNYIVSFGSRFFVRLCPGGHGRFSTPTR